MTTTTFENATSRAVEDAALTALRRAWKISRDARMPDKCGADFRITAPVIGNALVEIKGRTRSFLSANTVEIATKKVDALRALAGQYGVPAYLVFVMLVDRSLWWIDVATIDKGLNYIGGRKPRKGSANDQEPMILIPLALLTPVSGETIDGGVANDAIRWNMEHRT